MTNRIHVGHSEELAIARDYIDERLEFVRAAWAFEERTLMAHPEGTLRYLNEFRTNVVTYTAGRDLVNEWLHRRAGEADGRWTGLLALISAPEQFRPK